MKRAFLLITLILTAACLTAEASMFARLKGGRVTIEKPITVPFSITAHHLPVLDAGLNGTPVKMVLDTGGITMIDSSLCTELNLEKEDLTQFGMTLVKLDSISLGDIRVYDMKANVLNFEDKFKMHKFGIRGMIGSDLLRFFQTEIDYSRAQFIFSKPEKMVAKSGKDHLMDMNIILPYLPAVRATVNNSLELDAVVDTGVQFGLVIPYSYLENEDIRGEKQIVECEGMFASWPYAEQNRNALMKVDLIEFGDLVLKDQTVLFADLPKFGGKDVILLGRDFLNDYKTRLDYENLQVCLQEAPFRNEDIAFSIGTNLVFIDGNYELKGIWKGSPADKQGLKVGDKFSLVNGKEDISGDDLYWLLVNPEVKEITLTYAESGKEITLEKQHLLKP
jgi:hypothetical protein